MVIVPPGTPGNQYGNLTIYGRAIGGGLRSTAETRGVIAVEPYFRVGLFTENPLFEISPGGQAFYTIWIHNDGNAVDSFHTLEIMNLRELTARHWTIILSSTTIGKIEPGESKPARLTAASPKDEQYRGDYYLNIVVRVTSLNAKDFQQVVSQNLTLTVHVRSNLPLALNSYILIIALSVVVAYLAVRLVRQQKRGR
jgi:uncharacterized membrane protein